MPQFSMTSDREKILSRYPDYEVKCSPFPRQIEVLVSGRMLGRSKKALLVEETRHNGVFYLPRADVNLSILKPSKTTTYCPFKGKASYWSIQNGSSLIEDCVWSYEAPYNEVKQLRGLLSFDPEKIEVRRK